MSWTPAETWLFIAFLAIAVAFVVWAGRTAFLDRFDRLPMLVPDPEPGELDVHLHLSLLYLWQRQVAASYDVPGPTPVDDSGRVWKVSVDFDRGGPA